MKNSKTHKAFLYFTFPLAFMIAFTAYRGIFIEAATYPLETDNWRIQSIGQDLVDLFIIVPVLLISGIFSYRKKKIFSFIFAGTVLFIAYSYTIYCFNVHFNNLFILYCLILGLSVYAFIYSISFLRNLSADHWFYVKTPVKLVGSFLFAVALVFYFLWLKDILPFAIRNNTPDILEETGLWTNPVHVLDIALILPAFIITSILLITRKTMGYILASPMMVFILLMNINIGSLSLYMRYKNISNDSTVSIMMGALALVSAALLYSHFKHLRKSS
jgi:hypothetical protein